MTQEFPPSIILDLKEAYKRGLVTCSDSDLLFKWCSSILGYYKITDYTLKDVSIDFTFSEDTGPVRTIEWECSKTYKRGDEFAEKLIRNAINHDIQVHEYIKQREISLKKII